MQNQEIINKAKSCFFFNFSFPPEEYDNIVGNIDNNKEWIPYFSDSKICNKFDDLRFRMLPNISNLLDTRGNEFSPFKIYFLNSNTVRNKLFKNVCIRFTSSEIFSLNVSSVEIYVANVGLMIIMIELEFSNFTITDLMKINSSFSILNKNLEDIENIFGRTPRRLGNVEALSANSIDQSKRIIATSFNSFSKQIRLQNYFYLRDLITVLLGNNFKILNGQNSNFENARVFKYCIIESKFDTEKNFEILLHKVATFFSRVSDETINFDEGKLYGAFTRKKVITNLRGVAVGLNSIYAKDTSIPEIFKSHNLFKWAIVLILIQRNTLFEIESDIYRYSRLFNNRKISWNKHLKKINILNQRFLEFTSFFWFISFSPSHIYHETFNMLRQLFDLDHYYENVRNQLDLLHNYASRKNDSRISKISLFITSILFPVTLVFGILGMNVAEFNFGSPPIFSIIPLTIIFGSLFIALIIFIIFRSFGD